jgi:hypothetical protein
MQTTVCGGSAPPESARRPIGPITLGAKRAGERRTGKPYAPFEVAGAGDGLTATPTRARSWKRRRQPRGNLRGTAPVLDPTGSKAYLSPQRVVRGEGSRACTNCSKRGALPAGPTERGGPPPLSNSPRGLRVFFARYAQITRRAVSRATLPPPLNSQCGAPRTRWQGIGVSYRTCRGVIGATWGLSEDTRARYALAADHFGFKRGVGRVVPREPPRPRSPGRPRPACFSLNWRSMISSWQLVPAGR